MTATATAPPRQAKAVPVTLDNFIRAESDMYFTTISKESRLGQFHHRREPASIDNQTVIRLNRDTLYSSAVFDLDAGPVTITLPDSGSRFMSLMIVNQDHYVQAVHYGKGKYTLTRESIGTRYVLAGVRTLVDPASPADLKDVAALQDAIKVEQTANGTFEVPNWDLQGQKKLRDALLVLNTTVHSFRNAFGKKDEVNPIYHLVATAAGWGGNPDKDAQYLNVYPEKNDGTTAYRLVVKDVPVDAFWSVSVYNAAGYFEKNSENAYTVNSITGKKGADGAITIQFGGAAQSGVNRIPIVAGWNYVVRMYRPRPEILSGKWTFPEPQPIG